MKYLIFTIIYVFLQLVTSVLIDRMLQKRSPGFDATIASALAGILWPIIWTMACIVLVYEFFDKVKNKIWKR